MSLVINVTFYKEFSKQIIFQNLIKDLSYIHDDMETLSLLLAICARNPSITSWIPLTKDQ